VIDAHYRKVERNTLLYDASAAITLDLHKIDFEIIEKKTFKNYAKSLSIFGDLLVAWFSVYEITTN
jgi:hypothetical protein